MRSVEMMRTARMIVEECVSLRSDEQVVVVADTETVPIAEVLAQAAHAGGGEVVISIMTPREQHGNEPPRPLAAAMQAADVVLMAVTHAITHTTAHKEALARGARACIMRSVTVDTMIHGAITADYREVRAVTQRLMRVLDEARRVRVTSPEGTDLTLSIEGRKALGLYSFATEPGTFTSLPSGEAAIAPLEGSAEGVLVFDHAIDNVGRLDTPVRAEVREGRIVGVDGGPDAERLRSLLQLDANATNIAEFAIGTNPRSRLLGNMAEDKILLGTVHIGIGDNHAIGGRVESQIHLDGILLNPTVEIDGQRIVEQRRLLVRV